MGDEDRAGNGMSVVGERARQPAYEEKRMQILEGAAAAFAEDGYHQTTVNSLADRLGVSKPVLYYYAKSKEDILAQIDQIAIDRLREVMSRAQRLRLSGNGKIRHFFKYYAESMCSDFGRCAARFDSNVLAPEIGAENLRLRRTIEVAVREMIVEGQADGSVAECNPDLAARVLFGAFNGITRWYREGGDLSADDVAEGYIDLLFTGLGRS